MRPLLVAAIAACGSGASPSSDPPTPPVHEPREPIHGAHGGVIEVLAVTADGRAAVSGDRTGGLRLWPTLDGTREPIVMTGAFAASLAIAHDGSGFAVAITDDARRVEVVRVDTRGHVRSRHALGEAVQVVALDDAWLVVRADHVIDHVAFDGTLLASLPAEPGHRIGSIAARGGEVRTVIAAEKDVYVRAIERSPLAWGTRSKSLALAFDSPLVLASDGSAVLARSAKGQQIVHVELATGASRDLCPAAVPRARRSHHRDVTFVTPAEPLAIAGDRAACVVDRVLHWWNLESGVHTTANIGALFEEPSAIAAASDRIVIANDQYLALHAPDRVEYLGYGFRDLTHVKSVPAGILIGKGDQEPVLLDDEFRERARVVMPKLVAHWADLLPIDERYVLATSPHPAGGSAYQIAVYDSEEQAMHQVLPYRARGSEIVYEPATRLLAASDGKDFLLMRVDGQHAIGGAVKLALAEPPRRVALVDPALADGLVAIAVHDAGRGALTVFEFHGRDLPAPSERGVVKARRSYPLTGDLLAIDRAGRLYVAADDAVDVRVRGERRALLPGVQTAKLRPSPDGEHVVAFAPARVTLFAIDGRRLWDVAAWSVSDVDWTASGTLFARFPNALARLDLATGALAERQCGWAFGISPTAHASTSATPSVCDVP